MLKNNNWSDDALHWLNSQANPQSTHRVAIAAQQSTHRVVITHGVHSIMMEKSALAGEDWCTPTPFHSSYHHLQSCSVRSSWEGGYTPSISSLPLYVLCGLIHVLTGCQMIWLIDDLTFDPSMFRGDLSMKAWWMSAVPATVHSSDLLSNMSHSFYPVLNE